MTDGGVLKASGVILPSGERRDLFVVDGQITYDAGAPGAPAASSITDAFGDAWIVAGLVDAHCHIGLDEHGAVPDDVSEEQAVADRDAGTLLVRDAGSAADTRWIDERQDLPRVIRAGRHLARPKRYIRNYAHEIEPEELPAYVAQEAQRGDGWVKLVGDWIDRDAEDLTPLWPRDALQAAIDTAHAYGARVTAHVFGPDALPDLFDAGIDCIEHGTGLSADLIDQMVTQHIALVPTAKQLEHFPDYAAAGEAKFPAYAARMRDLYERRQRHRAVGVRRRGRDLCRHRRRGSPAARPDRRRGARAGRARPVARGCSRRGVVAGPTLARSPGRQPRRGRPG